MNFIKEWAGVVAVLLLVYVVFVPRFTEDNLGAAGGLLAENYLPFVMYNDGYNSAKDIKTSGTLSTSGAFVNTGTSVTGTNGSTIVEMIAGSCALVNNPTVSATSTATVDCAVTGVTSGDIVHVQASTTVSAGAPFIIAGAKASTTASGYITMSVSNLTGAAANIPTNIASGTMYWVVDTN